MISSQTYRLWNWSAEANRYVWTFSSFRSTESAPSLMSVKVFLNHPVYIVCVYVGYICIFYYNYGITEAI